MSMAERLPFPKVPELRLVSYLLNPLRDRERDDEKPSTRTHSVVPLPHQLRLLDFLGRTRHPGRNENQTN